MKKQIKYIVKLFFRVFGLKISGISRGELSDEKKLSWFKRFDFKTIIDVGASKGNASAQFRAIFSEANIYAFEPLKDCSEIIKNKFKDDSKIRVYNLALSDFKGESEIFRSSYSGASSMIKMADLHKKLFPVVAGESKQPILVDTLDNIFSDTSLREPILIKLDVQGAEDKVIKGGENIFKKARVVIVETSFRLLYEGQPLFNDISNQLEKLGFKYSGIWGEGDFKSPEDGSPLQQDSIFIRNE